MRKRAFLSGAVLFLAIAGAALAAVVDDGAAAPAREAESGREAQLERQLGPGTEVALHRETGRVRFIGTAPGRPIPRPPGLGAGAPPVAVARAFLDSHGRRLGLDPSFSRLRVASTAERLAAAYTAVRLRQEIDGIPVLAGEVVVGVDGAGNVLSALGELEPDRPDTSAEVTADEARRIAIASVAKDVPRAGRLRTAEPELAIYDSRLLGGPGLDIPLLVWQTEVSSPGEPRLRRLVLVDANVGVVAETIDLIEEAKDRRVCDAENKAAHYPCVAPYDREEVDPPSGQPDIDAAFDFAGDTYDFFFDRFGRDSLDGAGMPLISTVRYCPEPKDCPYQNAFWDGSQMTYGEGFAEADDVVGHELSHGVTDFSSRLFYWYQSGAINESMSDVFGEYMDLVNGAGDDGEAVRWLVGEDIPGIGAIRDMQDPTAFGDPDRMTSSKYVADSTEADNGGVHSNSGVNNKAAYLIADGDTFNGRTVTGIGIDKAARVYYDTNTAQLTSGSDYADLYQALQQACTNAIGGAEGITAADCLAVTDAVEATEMDQQPLNAPAPEAPVCGEGETQANLFFDDLEYPASGNWAHSALSGNDGWYYPQNPNPYEWFDATYATSGETNFWGDDHDETADFAISQTADVAIPAGSVYLRFDHSHAFEDGKKFYDGGQVEYSIDGGATWLDAGSLFTHNGYNGTITSQFDNPLGGEAAFVAESNGYISSRVDLSSLAGEEVRFRFRIGTDLEVGDYGWFIDDIHVYGCEDVPDETPPAAPTLTATEPASPANHNEPKVKGSAEAGSTVRLYESADCSGAVEAEGSAPTFESSGLTASVAADATTQFTATATDATENTSPCSASLQYTEDSTPPTDPSLTSPSHDVEVPSNDPTVEISFSGAADNLSGVDGFSYHWDTSPATTPDESKDAEESAAGANSPSLAEGTSHYFHLRTRDNAGNWTSTVHLGPFAIDTSEPAPEPEPQPEPEPEPDPEPEPVPEPPPPPSFPAPEAFPPPDATPPSAALFSPRWQVAGRAILVRARCDEPCTVVAAGRVVAWRGAGRSALAGMAARRRVRIGLRRVVKRLAAGQATALRLRPRSRRARRRLGRLARRGWRMRAAVVVRYVDGAGNSTRRRIVVRLRSRPRPDGG